MIWRALTGFKPLRWVARTAGKILAFAWSIVLGNTITRWFRAEVGSVFDVKIAPIKEEMAANGAKAAAAHAALVSQLDAHTRDDLAAVAGVQASVEAMGADLASKIEDVQRDVTAINANGGTHDA